MHIHCLIELSNIRGVDMHIGFNIESFAIEELGFTEAEFETINNHFTLSLSYLDWDSFSIHEAEEEIEEDGSTYEDIFLKLPTGRLVEFPRELVRLNKMDQMD